VILKKVWDLFAPNYDLDIHLNAYQGFVTLAVHTEVHKKKKILEVACGSGLHSLYPAKTLL
jgi:hypothetical protein